MIYNQSDRKVIFLVHQYEPQPKVCELCVMRVQESLLNIGIRSDVLEYSGARGLVKTTAYGDVYSIGAAKPRVDTTKKNIIKEYFKKIPMLFRWPYLFKRKIRDDYKLFLDDLNKKNNYQAVIGVTLPVDTAMIAYEYDNFIHYELDSVANNPEYKRGIKKLYRAKLNRIERRLYDKAKIIIHMEYNRKYLEKYAKQKICQKFVFSDIPNLIESQIVIDGNDTQITNKIKLAYFGALVRDYRNPSYLIQVLFELNKRSPLQCEFFSRGNCEDILSDAAKSNPDVIIQRGYVDQKTVVKKQKEADILVSIGNHLTGTDYSLPSKIIEYIALGKPIIHIYGGANDSVIDYLGKYELGCVIYPEDRMEDNIEKLGLFIKKSKGKLIPFEQVRKKFYHNSPDYTAEIIKAFLDRS